MERRLAAGNFFGTKLRSHSIEGFWLTEWQYALAAKAPRHSHQNAYLNMVIQGGHMETLTGGEVVSGPQVLVFHPTEEVHGGEISCPDTRIFGIEIAPQRLEQLREIGHFPQERLTFTEALPVRLATRIYQEFVRMEALSPLVIEGLALELLAELGRRTASTQPSAPPAWLLQARDLLHARFADSFSLDEIARIVDVHPDHLVHSFRRQYHCTVGEYVRQLRIDYACRQIASSDLPLAEIALEAGFVDQSHFTKTFKRLTGMTPSEFQQRRRTSRL